MKKIIITGRGSSELYNAYTQNDDPTIRLNETIQYKKKSIHLINMPDIDEYLLPDDINMFALCYQSDSSESIEYIVNKIIPTITNYKLLNKINCKIIFVEISGQHVISRENFVSDKLMKQHRAKKIICDGDPNEMQKSINIIFGNIESPLCNCCAVM